MPLYILQNKKCPVLSMTFLYAISSGFWEHSQDSGEVSQPPSIPLLIIQMKRDAFQPLEDSGFCWEGYEFSFPRSDIRMEKWYRQPR